MSCVKAGIALPDRHLCDMDCKNLQENINCSTLASPSHAIVSCCVQLYGTEIVIQPVNG
jgi:hypothetical protein